jgi:sugar lactone lactonase YvrE
MAIALLAMLFIGLSGCFKKELLSPGRYSDTTIIAGSDSAGFVNGTGKVARFNHPFGLALDQAGNLYIADQGNSIIREMTPGLVVSTFAGMPGITGSANAADTLASFNKPFSVAVDGSNNVYVADAGNNLIRKIAADGTVSTFAGTGVPGSADGTDTATFNSPLGVAVDQLGNVYVADYGNNLIRKITSSGLVSTIAGKRGVSGSADGLDTAARFNLPESVAVDASGNIYVADNGNNEIRKVTPAGLVSTLAGNGTAGKSNGKGSGATFNSPFGLAVDASGNIYVADSGNNLIRKITPDATVSTFAGSGSKGAGDANGVQATFNTPAGLAIDASGNLYVSDENNNIIRKITPSGMVTTVAVSRCPRISSTARAFKKR